MGLDQAIAEMRAQEPSSEICKLPVKECGTTSGRASLPARLIPSTDVLT